MNTRKYATDFRSRFHVIFVLTSKDVHRGCHEVLGGQVILKRQKSRETAIISRSQSCAIKIGCVFFNIYTFLLFENALTSEDNMAASVDNKTASKQPQNPKFVQNLISAIEFFVDS